MSKRESRKRLLRRSKAYQKAMIVINVAFLAVIIAVIIFGCVHTFTHKKAYRNDGVNAFEKGEYEAAIESFDKALKCNQWFSKKMDADILMYKAESQVLLKQYEEANKTYRKLKKYNTSNVKKSDIDMLIDINDAYISFEAGNYEDCVEIFEKAGAEGYDALLLYAGIGYENLGNYEQMYKNYCKYEEKCGKTSFVCYKNAEYLLSTNQYEAAINYIEEGKVLEDKKYIKDILYTEILYYEHFGDYERAYNLAKDYTEEYPDDDEGLKMYDYLYTRVNPSTETVRGDEDEETDAENILQ